MVRIFGTVKTKFYLLTSRISSEIEAGMPADYDQSILPGSMVQMASGRFESLYHLKTLITADRNPNRKFELTAYEFFRNPNRN